MKIPKTIMKTIVVTALATMGASLFSATPAFALPCDDLGSNWTGCEYGSACEWKFEFRRQSCSSNLWNAYWSHSSGSKVQATLTITMTGSTVTIVRPFSGGVSCTYTGIYKRRDVHNALPYRVSGTYSCSSGYVGPWKATIR